MKKFEIPCNNPDSGYKMTFLRYESEEQEKDRNRVEVLVPFGETYILYNYPMTINCNELENFIVDIVTRAVEMKSVKVSSMRWYPNYDYSHMMGYGTEYIVVQAGCKGRRIFLNLLFGEVDTDHPSNTKTTKFTLTGYKKIESLLTFLNREVKLSE